MSEVSVQEALARLRKAADDVTGAFPVTKWKRISGSGPDILEMAGSGGPQGLELESGKEKVLSCMLDLPLKVGLVPLKGEPLLMTINSLFPIEVRLDEKVVFADFGVPVAAGPALIKVLDSIAEGDNGELTVIINLPPNQVGNWCSWKFHTPSLRRRFEEIDTAWAQLALADELAVTPEDKDLVAEAAAMTPSEFGLYDEPSLTSKLASIVEPILPIAARAAGIDVHLIGHSHIDMNWLWTWSDTVETIRRDIKSVLSLMDDYPELTFSHSQPATYDVIRNEEPDLFKKIRQHIKTGRWEPISMTWVEGDVNMASSEATARQFLEGVRYTREMLGGVPTTCHEPDTFGHAGNLPQVAVSAGAQCYYHHRANEGQENQWPAYWWEGQDGTRLLAISTYSYNGEIMARDLATAAIRAHKWGHPAGLHFHGIGDHGGGPSRQNLDSLRHFQQAPGLPKAFCSTLAAYTGQILNSGAALPVHRGESSTIFEGCYTTHADTKRYNRSGENLLTTADTLSALAGVNNNVTLVPAWRTVLFNQFHDILDGSAIHEAYEKNATDFGEVEAAAALASTEALDVLQAHILAGHIAVTNSLGFDREDVVLVPERTGKGPAWLIGDHGHVTPGQYTPHGLCFVAKAPAFGTVSYQQQAAVPQGAVEREIKAIASYSVNDSRQDNMLGWAPTEAPYDMVETPHFKTYVRRDCGIIVSFYDKRAGKELVGFGMRRGSDYVDTARPDLALGVLQILDELPHPMSSWQYNEVSTEHNLISGATTKVVENGPVRCVIETTHKVRESSITQRTIFYYDLPRIDFETKADWKELGNAQKGIPNLKVAFTARMLDCEAWFETPFAAVRRPADGQEVPALRWADVGGDNYGFALLNDSKYGHDALGTRLRITLVRSAYEPDAISDLGEHEVRYSFYPHTGNWRDAHVVHAAAGFNEPLLARVKETGKGQPTEKNVVRPLLSGSSSIQFSGLKHVHEGGGVVVRLYESAGRAGEAILSALPEKARVWETNVVEDKLRELNVQNDSIKLTFTPWHVKTILIES